MATIYKFKIEYREKDFLGAIAIPYFASMDIVVKNRWVWFEAGISRAGDRLGQFKE